MFQGLAVKWRACPDRAYEWRDCSWWEDFGTEAAGSGVEGQAGAERPAGFGVRYWGRQ
jgi:hypothetical protein